METQCNLDISNNQLDITNPLETKQSRTIVHLYVLDATII